LRGKERPTRRSAKPAKAKVKTELPIARKPRKREGSKVRDLEKRLAQSLQREAEALKRESEALEQQTATSEILRVISSSPTDVQPVFDAIAASATRLCEAVNALIIRFDGQLLHLVAHHNVAPERLDALERLYPGRANRGGVSGRVVLTHAVVHVEDVNADPEYTQPQATTVGYRTALGVPMLREGEAIGLILVARDRVAPFSGKQIALLKTFVDQAVIAIENVRLFKELEARNRELTDSLDQQTATSEILRAISNSPRDVQPVFDAIAQSAARLCEAFDVSIFRVNGDRLAFVAHHGPIAQRHGEFSLPLVRGTVGGRSVLELRTVQVADLQNEDREFPDAVENARRFGFRTILSVPLLREGIAIGGIQLRRTEVQLFSERQVALLQTFADQAVIAIENVGLFTELQEKNKALTQAYAQVTEALDQQTATSDILRAISASPVDVQPVFDAIARNSVRLCNGVMGAVFRFDGEFMHIGALHGFSPDGEEATRRAFPTRPERRMLAARAVLSGAIVHVPDVAADPEFDYRALAATADWRGLLVVPMLRGDEVLGTVGVARAQVGPFPEQEIGLLKTFADQAVIAIENVRLFNELQASNREIAEKSRQIEVASQHKSEFLANMSHELRTPLNAIIGFSEVLSERMFGELNEKQEEYLKDIHASGQHLLSLINDILDLSKIEAGRMELELSDFNLPAALDSALTLVRERAGRHGIALQMTVDERLGQIRADERKIRQVVLNLLSNAIKFTPDGGRIDVRAVTVEGSVEVSVSDTGVGIAPEDQGAIFEEFRQVGTAAMKVEGTGLGLALSRKFIELHGGRISVESEPGAGSTFTFTLPRSPA
jgi:two-component system, NtrC family, sensor kinase